MEEDFEDVEDDDQHHHPYVTKAPVSALQGIAAEKQTGLKGLGVNTVGDLAKLKYFQWGEAIIKLSSFEK